MGYYTFAVVTPVILSLSLYSILTVVKGFSSLQSLLEGMVEKGQQHFHLNSILLALTFDLWKFTDIVEGEKQQCVSKWSPWHAGMK